MATKVRKENFKSTKAKSDEPKGVLRKFKIYGIVQGIGFRPLASKIAARLSFKGAVRNTIFGAEIFFVMPCSSKKIADFFSCLNKEIPDEGKILKVLDDSCNIDLSTADMVLKKITHATPFLILPSSKQDKHEIRMIPPDTGICEDCLRELEDRNNRRFGHALISCYKCGPRLSILGQFPYDRSNTSMGEFAMCLECKGEYESLQDRRFHAETISCQSCAPFLVMAEKTKGGVVRALNVNGTQNELLKKLRVARTAATTTGSPSNTTGLPNSTARVTSSTTGAARSVKKQTSKDNMLTGNVGKMVRSTEGLTATATGSPSNTARTAATTTGSPSNTARTAATTTGSPSNTARTAATTTGSPSNTARVASNTTTTTSNSEINMDNEILKKARGILSKGGLLLIKGTSAYHLVADCQSKTAISKLRDLKLREKKPFAIMIDNNSPYIKNNKDRSLLLSPKRPIVLFDKDELKIKMVDDVICDSSYVGVMFPSTGYQKLLVKNMPLVFTSANISSEAVLFKDSDAIDFFLNNKNIDAIIFNNREILVGQDDSLIYKNQKMLRRSKGYTPIPLNTDLESYVNFLFKVKKPKSLKKIKIKLESEFKKDIFATGADMKSSFAFMKNGFVYTSEFIGELGDNISLTNKYINSFEKFKSLFNFSPHYLVTDKHENYISTKLGHELLTKKKPTKIQHHKAHLASVILENNLLSKDIIGFSFDGTGKGDDDKIWGSEVFYINKFLDFKRVSSLKNTKICGGDLASKYNKLPALSYIDDINYKKTITPDLTTLSKGIKTQNEIKYLPFTVNLTKIISFHNQNKNSFGFKNKVDSMPLSEENFFYSSSLGRLFDTVSYLLGISEENIFEGYSAQLLEKVAVTEKSVRGNLARAFHKEIIKVIKIFVLDALKINKNFVFVFSGGVFLNQIIFNSLLKLEKEIISSKHFPNIKNETPHIFFFNKDLPLGDQNIAPGQALIKRISNINKIFGL